MYYITELITLKGKEVAPDNPNSLIKLHGDFFMPHGYSMLEVIVDLRSNQLYMLSQGAQPLQQNTPGARCSVSFVNPDSGYPVEGVFLNTFHNPVNNSMTIAVVDKVSHNTQNTHSNGLDGLMSNTIPDQGSKKATEQSTNKK